MSKKRDEICFNMKVTKHVTEENADKEPLYKVILKPKAVQLIGAGEATISMTVKSDDKSLFELLPRKSERTVRITMLDEQTELKTK
jgi:hypothetical protein